MSMADDALEREVQAIARRIAEAGASERAQLFRFVDVFPACRDDEDVLRHLT